MSACGKQQLCTFTVDGLWFGVDVLRVQEVIRFQQMTRVPLASSVVRGLINLRGQIVLAIDLSGRLGFVRSQTTPPPFNIVIQSADRLVSLLVDDVGDVVEFDLADLEQAPDTIGELRQQLSGILRMEDRLLLVLETNRLLDFDAAA